MTEAPAPAETTAAPEAPKGEEERTFTQADLKKIAANEKREGKKSAYGELLEKTGAESIDDVLSVYEAHKLAQAEMETAADKAEKQLKKEREAREQAEERYTGTLRRFAARDALRDAGINPERLKGALRLADLDALEVDKEGNVSGLESLVEAVREESPEWFSDTQERRPVRSPEATRKAAPQNNSYEGQMGGFLNSLLNAPPG